MRSARQQLLHSSLRALPKHPSEAQLASAVTALVDSALLTNKPLMSVGASLRHAGNLLDAQLRDRLRDSASAEIRKRASAVTVSSPEQGVGRQWLGVPEAARQLECSDRVLIERLRLVEHRRRLGWPMFDGYRWLIPAPALDPTLRPAFLLAQPDEEPLQELLPSSCERAPRKDGVPPIIRPSERDASGTRAEE